MEGKQIWVNKMEHNVKYGRKTYAISEGRTFHVSTSITEKARPGEDERNFTQRVTGKYKERQGTIEIVLKNGRPDYAIIVFSQIQ